MYLTGGLQAGIGKNSAEDRLWNDARHNIFLTATKDAYSDKHIEEWINTFSSGSELVHGSQSHAVELILVLDSRPSGAGHQGGGK